MELTWKNFDEVSENDPEVKKIKKEIKEFLDELEYEFVGEDQ